MKLRCYFQKHFENKNLNLENSFNNEAYNYWISPIIKIKDLEEAFNDVRDNYEKIIKKIMQIKKGGNYKYFEAHFNFWKSTKRDIWALIEKDLYDIKINIVKKEIPPVERNIYDDVVDLYLKNNYAEAFMKARDVFQNDLQKKFKEGIKYFENKKEPLSIEINNLLQSITNIRNKFAKYKNFDQLSKNKQRAFVKLSIEQIISIRDFVEILENK